MDRIKYRRLLPVYLADMIELEISDPLIRNDFMEGKFSAQKNDIPCIAIGYEQASEHINGVLKVPSGSSVVLTNNPNARLRSYAYCSDNGKFIPRDKCNKWQDLMNGLITPQHSSPTTTKFF